MNLFKITQLLSIFILFNLIACSDPVMNEPDSKQQVIERLKLNNNWLFVNSSDQLTESPMPFNQDYLANRHEIYKLLQQFTHHASTQKQLEYLIIEERFPERFYPWPPSKNVLLPILDNRQGSEFDVLATKVTAWLNFVEATLADNRNDRLALNRIELAQIKEFALELKKQLELSSDTRPSTEQLVAQLVQFNEFLSVYRPRASMSLSQQPNGSDWYQAKLNYYTGLSKSPNDWLNDIFSAQKNSSEGDMAHHLKTLHNLQSSLSLDDLLTLFNAPKNLNGLDWRTGYVDVVAAFKEVKVPELTPAHRKAALTLAAVDLGVHYQSWSYLHAEQFLIEQLAIQKQQAEALIHFVVLQPGVSIAPAAQLYL